MGFLNDFCYLAEGTECPKKFMIWSGLSLLGAVAGKKIWTGHGTQVVTDTKLYVAMVGTPGSGKSFAMEKAEGLYVKYFPDYMVSDSVQSREDILKKMTLDACTRTYKLPDGRIEEYHPFYCIVDELENFLSVDDARMIATLVGIYSRPVFSTGFKTDDNPNQKIKNPYLSVLACTIPEWMMSSLRQSLFTGGLGRRLIIVYSKKEQLIPFPNKPKDYDIVEARIASHLRFVDKAVGHLEWTPESRAWWEKWYMARKRDNSDPLLQQMEETEQMPMQKVAALLALSEHPDKLVIEKEHFEAARLLLEDLKEDIIKLTSSIGRNELAGIANQVLAYIEQRGGMVREIQLLTNFERYAKVREWDEIIMRLQQREELRILQIPPPPAPNGKRYFLTNAGYETLLRDEAAKKQQNGEVK